LKEKKMLRKKELLLFCIGINSIAGAAVSADSYLENKYSKVYNKMTENYKKGRSNKENYKLLESILKKRNKELNELYIQNDYVVKPEYLEWQLFFSGFYNNETKGKEKEKTVISAPHFVNTLTLTTKMSDYEVKEPNINLDKIAVNVPEVNVAESNVIVPGMNYSNNVIVPEFTLPEMVPTRIPTITLNSPNTSFGTNISMKDNTYYSPTFDKAFLFSNYNLEKGNFDYVVDSPTTSTRLSTYTYSDALGTIDPTAIPNAALNQPAVIPTSGNESVNRASFFLASTASPNIRIGENVNINFSGTAVDNNTYGALLVLGSVGSINRSALNADTDYAYGGSKQYADALSNVPFSILRNSANINVSGKNRIVQLITSDDQSTTRSDYVLVNDGTIIGNYSGSSDSRHVGMAYDTWGGRISTSGERYVIINDGKMEFRAPDSSAFQAGGVNIKAYQTLQNRGEVTMYGARNFGILISHSSLSGANPRQDMINTKIIMDTPINIQGDKSAGVFANITNMKLEDSKIKINIGTEKNKYSGNETGMDPNYVENSVGLYVNPFTSLTGSSGVSKLVDFDIKFGDYAKNSILIYNKSSDVNQVLSVENSVVNAINVENGEDNVVFYNGASSSYASSKGVLNIKPDINIGSPDKAVNGTTGVYNNGGLVHLNGNINTYGAYSNALYNTSYIWSGSTVYGNIDNIIDGTTKPVSLITNGENSTALYNYVSSVNFSEGGTYKSLGNQGTTVYNEKGTVNISGNALFEAENSSTLLRAAGGSINLNGDIIYNVRNNSLFAETDNTLGTQINLTGGNQTLNLEDGSIGFLYDGKSFPLASNSLINYLNTNFLGLNNLNVNISDDSRLFVINDYGTMKLSEFSALNDAGSVFKSVNGNLLNSLINKGILELDTVGTINLDDPNDIYSNIDKAATGITVNNGTIVRGSKDGQVALGGKDQYRGTTGGSTYVIMNNNGTIDLSGNDSIGIYADNGIINNTSSVKLSGNNSAGLFGENGTVVTNNGIINIADNSVGIYSVSYQDPGNPETKFGDGTITVTNNNEIKADNSQKAVGIYVNNNKTGAARNTGNLNLSNGTVDVSSSVEGTGVFAENSSVTGGGTITVGEKGIGLYAKNSDLNLSGLTLNLKGDNSLGIYLDSGSNLNTAGTNTINVSGINNTLFYKDSDGIFNQNFLINADNGANYTLLYTKNNKIDYEGNVGTSGGGALFYGLNSTITLGNNTVINSTGNNSVGLYADELYNNGLSEYEGVNKGSITVKDNSAGLYAVNGARLLNENSVSTGNSSLGMYGKNSRDMKNTGIINIGSSSVGIAAVNSESVINDGIISSTGDKATGLYSVSTNALNIENNGTIELKGKNSTGVYLEGTGAQIFNNNSGGTIKVGDSDDISNPDTAVYNEGNTINNSGSINAGKNSLGIYNRNGNVNHTGGTISSDTGGISIYTVGGNVSMNGGKLKSNGVGIYAFGTNITNMGTSFLLGDNTTAYVLKEGSALNGNQNAVIGDSSVYVYGDGAGNIDNSGQITMTGKNSTAYYAVNSGDINNTADISGIGTGNVGIYSNKGNIKNSGNIILGDSEIIDVNDPANNKYALGIYGEDVEITNSGNIRIGKNGTGIYVENNKAVNTGEIESDGEYVTAMRGNNSEIENNNKITLNGNYSYGMLGERNSIVRNNGIITLNGDNSVGISGDSGTKIYNNGSIILGGNNSTGIMLSNGSVLLNRGIIDLGSGAGNVEIGNGSNLTPPSIINAGVIKVDGKFKIDGPELIVQVEPNTIRTPEVNEIINEKYEMDDIKAKFLFSNSVKFKASSFDFKNPAYINPLFTQGTNALVYKFENIFEADDIASVEKISASSNSVTFKATPSVNSSGALDIWMEKIPYQTFTAGTAYEEMAKILDKNYVIDGVINGQTEEALKLYDKLDMITDSVELTNAFNNISGEMYANILHREENIKDTFVSSLELLQNSENNTKENIKVNVIAGKGEVTEKSSDVSGYSYTTAGAMALREVERTYRHTFGYSLGYLHTEFEMEDSDNKDKADSIQIGLHNKYTANSWKFKNSIMGSASLHKTNREINWDSGSSSILSGDYSAYGITSLNEVAKEFKPAKNFKIEPYMGLELGYTLHTDFEESGGAERLKIDNNDIYSIKPNTGVRFEGTKEFGSNNNWQLKMNLGVGYEYELGNTNKQEKAGFSALDTDYYSLAKPADEKGKFKTNGLVGVELKERYGIYVTGEYGIGKDDEDYKVGISFKAAF
jgi:hypothetical protein